MTKDQKLLEHLKSEQREWAKHARSYKIRIETLENSIIFLTNELVVLQTLQEDLEETRRSIYK